MNETRSVNSGFIDSTRGGTLVAAELRAKEQRKRDRELQYDEKEPTSKPTQFDDVYEGDWFVDAEDDEELADTLLQKHGFSTFDRFFSLQWCLGTNSDGQMFVLMHLIYRIR
jgi:hypothetical protein